MSTRRILTKFLLFFYVLTSYALAVDLSEFEGEIKPFVGSECIDCVSGQSSWVNAAISGEAKEIDVNQLRNQLQSDIEMKAVMDRFEFSIRLNGLEATVKAYHLDRPENYDISNEILSQYMRGEALKLEDNNFEDTKKMLLEKNITLFDLDGLEKLKEIRNKNAADNAAFIEDIKSNFSYDREFQSSIYKDSIMHADDFTERRKFILNMAEIGTDQYSIGNIIHEYIVVESITGESDDELIRQLARSYDFNTVLGTDNIMCMIISDVDGNESKKRKKKLQKMFDRLFDLGVSPQSICQDGLVVTTHLRDKGFSLENLPVDHQEKPCVTFSGDASVTDLCDMTRVVYDIVKRMSDNERLNGKKHPKDLTGIYMASEEECNYSLFDRFYIDDNGVFRRSMKVELSHKHAKEPVLIEGNEKDILVQSLRKLVKP